MVPEGHHRDARGGCWSQDILRVSTEFIVGSQPPQTNAPPGVSQSYRQKAALCVKVNVTSGFNGITSPHAQDELEETPGLFAAPS